MKRRVAIVIALICMVGVDAKAFDFAVPVGNGDSLFFDVADAVRLTARVVYPSANGNNYYMGHRQPGGDLVIPSNVRHNGQNYTVVSIGNRAFSGCTALRSVSLPASVVDIGAYAFYGCTGLKGRIVIPPQIRHIGASAFYGCSGIDMVLFRATDCVEMGGSMSTTVFGNCRSLKNIVVEEGVGSIPSYAFCGLDAVSGSLKLPASLKSIGDYAFAYCSHMSGSLTIPDSVVSIGECAFHQCHSLTALTLGMSVKSIGGRAFYHCVGLKRITVRSVLPPETALTTFSDLSKSARFVVPCVSKKVYEQNGFWKKLTPFDTFGDCFLPVEASFENDATGVVIGAGRYGYGDSVTLVAVCAAGQGFLGWSDGVADNPRRFVAERPFKVKAITQPSGIVTLVDTVYSVDTVYADGIKVVHDTIDIIEHAAAVSGVDEVQYDAMRGLLTWTLPKREKVLSVSLFNQTGECVFSGKGKRGSIRTRRFPTGSYIVRIETVRRVLRCRFFVLNVAP